MRAVGFDAALTLAVEKGKKDVIQVNEVGSSKGTVTVTAAANGSPKAATVSISASRKLSAQFILNNLTLTPGQPISFGLAPDGGGVVIHNSGSAATFDLSVQNATAAAKYKGHHA